MRDVSLLLSGALLLGAAAALLSLPVRAATGDIVWPTYTMVQKPHDTILTCPQLHIVIDKIASDLQMLDTAQIRAEDAVHQAYDNQSSEGREQGGAFLNSGITKAGFEYTAARDTIMASKKIAIARREYLTGLLTSCKNPAPGVAAPAP